MKNIYMTHCYYNNFKNPIKKYPRSRYVEYYRDLHSLFNEPLADESFWQGSQYSYAELGRSVLDQADKDDRLRDLDLMVIATWAYEFDPDYASCGTHFAEHYKIKGLIFDVADQGVLSPVSAIQLIVRYLETDEYKSALLLVMEQTCIPRGKKFEFSCFPEMTAAMAIRFDNQGISSCRRLRLIEVGSVTDFKIQGVDKLPTINRAYPSCIRPFLDLNSALQSTRKKSFYKMLIKDVESKEERYLVWESNA
jgi:hypothetical protein